MGLLFDKGASRGEKIHTICFLAFAFATIYAFYSGFRPSAAVYEAAPYLGIPASLPFFLPFVLDWNAAKRMRTYGLLKRLLLYAAGIVLFYVFAVVGVAVTLPAVATLVIGEEFTGQYKVIAKGDGRFRFKDRCNTHAIHLRSSLPGSLDTKVCLGEEAWSAVKVGDVLTIKGHQSQFGILLEEYWPARPPS